MSQEKYKLSPEEMRKGSEMMTPEQKDMTVIREIEHAVKSGSEIKKDTYSYGRGSDTISFKKSGADDSVASPKYLLNGINLGTEEDPLYKLANELIEARGKFYEKERLEKTRIHLKVVGVESRTKSIVLAETAGTIPDAIKEALQKIPAGGWARRGYKIIINGETSFVPPGLTWRDSYNPKIDSRKEYPDIEAAVTALKDRLLNYNVATSIEFDFMTKNQKSNDTAVIETGPSQFENNSTEPLSTASAIEETVPAPQETKKPPSTDAMAALRDKFKK